MAQPRMNVSLVEGGAALTLLPGSGAQGSVTLSVAQLGELIAALGAARARLVGQLPAEAPERKIDAGQVKAVIGPAWAVRPEAMTEGSMLVFAHPGYGTVGFVLAPAEIEKMVRALRTHLGMVHTGETGELRN